MKIEIKFELDEEVIAAFDDYCIESKLNRDDVASSIISDYINRMK